MSDVGVFGGRGVSEETYLQNARCQYTVLNEIDIDITKDYRRFKFLIFPSRLSSYSKLCFESMQNNSAFKSCIEKFLLRGGRILLCPHASLASDFYFNGISDNNQDSVAVNYLPITGLELHGIKSQRKSIQLKIKNTQHQICKDLKDKQKTDTYVYFVSEKIPNAEIIVSNQRGRPLLTQIPFGEGFILASSIDLPFLGFQYSNNLDEATNLFNSILRWGLDVPSIAVTFNSLIMLVRTKIGKHEAHLMEKAERAVLVRRFSEACDYAYRAFERIICGKVKGNMTLYNAINSLFTPNSSDHHFCHAIRLSRNASAHGTRLPEEFTVEETECLFSSIKFVVSRLI